MGLENPKALQTASKFYNSLPEDVRTYMEKYMPKEVRELVSDLVSLTNSGKLNNGGFGEWSQRVGVLKYHFERPAAFNMAKRACEHLDELGSKIKEAVSKPSKSSEDMADIFWQSYQKWHRYPEESKSGDYEPPE